jgi:hypothetical protein
MLKAVRAGKASEVLDIAAAHIDEIRATSLLALG